jgi:hypothetical protein
VLKKNQFLQKTRSKSQKLTKNLVIWILKVNSWLLKKRKILKNFEYLGFFQNFKFF